MRINRNVPSESAMKPRKKYALFGVLAAFLLTLVEHIAATYITHEFVLPLARQQLTLLVIASFIFGLIGWYLGGESHSPDASPPAAHPSVNPDVRVTRLAALYSKVYVLGHNGTAKIRDLFSIGSETIIRGPAAGNAEKGQPDSDQKSKGE
jgi:hypothetical protein